MVGKSVWENRIVGHGVVKAEQLLANESNWRVHPRYQQEVVEEALDEIGWIQDVVVNKRSGEEWGSDRGVETLVDGHLRVTLALRRGEDVPVKYVDLTPEEEKLALLTLDPSSALAKADSEILGRLLEEARGLVVNDGALSALYNELAENFGGKGSEDEKNRGREYEEEIEEGWMILVECDGESEQLELLKRLNEEGYRVRSLIR